MADKKVSDLPSLNGADVDPADLLYIVDSSAGAAGSKKITVGQYQLAPVSGGTANTVVYLNGSKVESSSSALTFDGTNFATTGTSSAAKLIPTGGTATGNGMYLPAVNTLAWSNNGAETMRLDSSGNLGIGTSSPGAKLDVSQSQNGQTAVQLTNSNAGASAEATFIANNGTYIGSFGVAGASKSAFGAILASDAYIFSNANVANTGITLMANSANGVIKFATGGSTETMRLNSSGNLGLGVTPSAWDTGFKAAQVDSQSAITGSGANTYLSTNWFYTTSDRYIANGFATLYRQNAGQHIFYTAPSGTAGNAITFTQAMTLDADGDLGIGSTSPSYPLHINKSFSLYGAYLNNTSTSTGDYSVFVATGASSGMPLMMLGAGGTTVGNAGVQGAGYVGTQNNTPLVFVTNDAARARITSGGEVYIAGTTDQGAYNLQVNGTGVWGAGAYVNGSDERLKDNIQTLNDGLAVVSQLRPVTFQYKPEHSKDQSVQPGFIAQELQQAMAGKDYVDGVVQSGPEYLNVAYQNLIPILTKAIQEQQALITALTARVAALEAK